VDVIVERLDVSNLAPLIEWLVDGEELVEHVAVIHLLRSNTMVPFIVLRSGIGGVAISWISDDGIPDLEMVLFLWDR
jgi:hypothetical protein